MPPQDYVIKTATNTYRIRVPDGMDPDKALSLAAATNEGFAQEYGALQAHQKTMLSDQMKPYEFGGPSVGRPPGGGEEAMLAEGAPPAAEALSTIGMAGALKANPIAALRAIAGGAAGTYAGGHGGRYLGGLIGAPEAGETVGALGGGLLGGIAGARGIPVHGKGNMLESIFSRGVPAEPEVFPVEKSPGPYRGPASVPKPTQAEVFPLAKSPGPYRGPSSVQTLAPEPIVSKVSQGPGPYTGPVSARKGGLQTPPSATSTIVDPSAPPDTSLLSIGRTLIEPGMEPDMTNPVHKKMINMMQTRAGADSKYAAGLRTLADKGDRFAAFVLRTMPRP